jgi:cytochrome b561
MSQSTWDRGTRWLHGGLSLAVTFQLFVSLVMEVPQPGLRPQPLGLQGFRAHECVGATLIAIVLAHWIWVLGRPHGQAIRHLFPWDRLGRAGIVADLRNLKGGKLPEGGPGGGLPGLIHGLGLLAVTGMAASGGLILLLFAPGSRDPLLQQVVNLHAALANVVWLYWLGHVSMVIVHESRGHRIVAGIFKP